MACCTSSLEPVALQLAEAVAAAALAGPAMARVQIAAHGPVVKLVVARTASRCQAGLSRTSQRHYLPRTGQGRTTWGHFQPGVTWGSRLEFRIPGQLEVWLNGAAACQRLAALIHTLAGRPR